MSTRRKHINKAAHAHGPNRKARRAGMQRGGHFPLMKSVSTTSGQRPVIPPEMDVMLSFQVNKTITNAAGTTAMVRYTVNGAYDVDPVLGSTSTPGFAEWATLYTYYRVVKSGYKIEICNNEAFPVRVYSLFQNTDPGTVGNLQFPGNPLAKSFLLSAKGGQDRTVLRDTQQTAVITGARGVEFEDNYRAAVTANPVDLTWMGIGGNSIGIAFFAKRNYSRWCH